MSVQIGVRVVRGPNWSWEDQDGGEGSVGTLVEVKESVPEEEETFPSGTTVKVCWDIAVLSNYRCGFDEKYDLLVFDNAQTGIFHQAVTCDDCKTSPLYRMRWKCATCYDYDLCTECYMSDKHSLEHRFLRYDSPDSEGIPVPARSGSRRVQAKGFFKGAVVSRGKDWNWGDQDGGIGKAGILKVLKGWHTESYRSVGEIQWESSDTSNIYRLGHKGKVDLKCDTPGDGGQYYPGHLPIAGAPPSLPPEVDEAVMVVSGDRVRVSVDAESFKRLQEDHGGWNHLMNQLLEKTGVVHSVLDCGDVRIEWDNRVWTINPASLVRDGDGHRLRFRPLPNDSTPKTSSLSNGSTPKASSFHNDSTPTASLHNDSTPTTSSLHNDSTPTTSSLPNGSTPKTSSLHNDSTPTTSSLHNDSTPTISLHNDSTPTTSLHNDSTATTSSLHNNSTPATSSLHNNSTPATSSLHNDSTPTTSSLHNDSTTKASSLHNDSTPKLVKSTAPVQSVVVSSELNQGHLQKDHEFHFYQSGDVVRVIDDLAQVYRLQDGHGGWIDDIALSLGQVGRVIGVFETGDCKVWVNGQLWSLNPKALVPAPGENPPDVPDGIGAMGLRLASGSKEELKLLAAIGDPRAAIVAVFQDDIQFLEEFLPRNPSVVHETFTDANASLLHVATSRGQVRTVRLLLECKANVNKQDLNGRTPLHLACHKHNLMIVELLLDAGADPGITSENSFNCLHVSSRGSFLRACELILKKFPQLLNVRKQDGVGPLHLACLNGGFEVAKFLVEHERCDIDAITYHCRSALHHAIRNGFFEITELLIGHGIDLNVMDEDGCTALHLAVALRDRGKFTIPLNNSPELNKICSTLSDLPSAMVGSAAVACLLVREGADPYCVSEEGSVKASPLQLCPYELQLHLTKFSGERSTFHGSLRKSLKPTSADLVEEEERHTPQKTVEEPPKPQEEHELVQTTVKETAKKTLDGGHILGNSSGSPLEVATPTTTHMSAVTPIPKTVPTATPTDTPIPETTSTDTPIPQTMSSVQPDEDEACLLCDKPIDVCIKPCGHTVLCRSHANTAKRCPQCRGPIHCIDDLDPLCGMCQERRCTVTLEPCGHMMCEVCALPMKRCFECKVKIELKGGLKEDLPSSEQSRKPQSDPTPITTTDSREPISDEDHLCEICCTNRKNTAFMCGHQLCYDCSLKVDNCPICRQEIKHRIKLH